MVKGASGESGHLRSGWGWSPLQGKRHPCSQALAWFILWAVPPWEPHPHLGLVSAFKAGRQAWRRHGEPWGLNTSLLTQKGGTRQCYRGEGSGPPAPLGRSQSTDSRASSQMKQRQCGGRRECKCLPFNFLCTGLPGE